MGQIQELEQVKDELLDEIAESHINDDEELCIKLQEDIQKCFDIFQAMYDEDGYDCDMEMLVANLISTWKERIQTISKMPRAISEAEETEEEILAETISLIPELIAKLG